MLPFLYIFAYNVIFRGRAVYPLLSRYGDKHLHLIQPLCVAILGKPHLSATLNYFAI